VPFLHPPVAAVGGPGVELRSETHCSAWSADS
jgi:hypothetical protein